jgi:hypothetical protein
LEDYDGAQKASEGKHANASLNYLPLTQGAAAMNCFRMV